MKQTITIHHKSNQTLVFNDAIGYQLGSGVILIMASEERSHIYPLEDVQEVVIVGAKEEALGANVIDQPQ